MINSISVENLIKIAENLEIMLQPTEAKSYYFSAAVLVEHDLMNIGDMDSYLKGKLAIIAATWYFQAEEYYDVRRFVNEHINQPYIDCNEKSRLNDLLQILENKE